MGWKDLFGKKPKKDDEVDIMTEFGLSDLKVGYLVDYDLKTWQVTGYNYIDWGGGDISREWQLKSYDETIYLEVESDDEDEWTVSWDIKPNMLDRRIFNHISEYDDPPEQIEFDGMSYFLEDASAGQFYEKGKGPPEEFLNWDYECGDSYLSISQWGERDFEVSLGKPVEEYQFTNILPGKK